jgi:hypothetical protein
MDNIKRTLFQFNYSLILVWLKAKNLGTEMFVMSMRIKKQGQQCTYNVISRCLCATIVAVEKQWVLPNLNVCNCSLRYPACTAHAQYCHMCPARLCDIFPHYLINDKIKRKVSHIKCVFWFSLHLETFFIARRIERGININVQVSIIFVRF